MSPRGNLVCMMAKVPVPGRVKTRLCPPLTPTQATELARAFVIDTWHEMAHARHCESVLSYAGDAAGLPVAVAARRRWPQVSGDLGARMEAVLARGLERAARVVIIGSDAPALPASLIERAHQHLEHADAVLGPALDGGYYLIGARRLRAGLLANLPWSHPRTLATTYRRLRGAGYDVAVLPTWFDVDDAGSLALFERVLALGALRAPVTADVLAAFKHARLPAAARPGDPLTPIG